MKSELVPIFNEKMYNFMKSDLAKGVKPYITLRSDSIKLKMNNKRKNNQINYSMFLILDKDIVEYFKKSDYEFNINQYRIECKLYKGSKPVDDHHKIYLENDLDDFNQKLERIKNSLDNKKLQKVRDKHESLLNDIDDLKRILNGYLKEYASAI
ncbi:hypothetical protein GF326_04625 [Candidatus Bathyarchaeota archaeon]|nr:hypothetical protein [Candidatus Bathyarchaeota archaeon]